MTGRDAIADVWGERTPYGSGEQWPVRVDMHLAEGVTEAEVQRWVRTASLLHSNGDAMDIAVKDGKIVGVRGRADDMVNRGRLGPKDLYGWQANASPDRLSRPLIRQGGRLVPCDWDTAMNRIVSTSKELLRTHGPSAIGFYTSGQLFAEEYFTLAAIGRPLASVRSYRTRCTANPVRETTSPVRRLFVRVYCSIATVSRPRR